MLSNEPKIIREEKFPRLVNVDIVPDNLLIAQCPKQGGKKVFAKTCIECEFFDGWLQLSNTGIFSKDFRSFCCHAIPRMLEELA